MTRLSSKYKVIAQSRSALPFVNQGMDAGSNMEDGCISSFGYIITFSGAAAKFSYPKSLAVDANGNVYGVDSFNSRICKITPAGVVTTFAGTLTGNEDGRGVSAKFGRPIDIAIRPGQ